MIKYLKLMLQVLMVFIVSVASRTLQAQMEMSGGMFSALVPENTVTHKATSSGNWSDPNIWEPAEVPGEAAIVSIPAGVTVEYDVNSNEHIFIIINYGIMNFNAPSGITRKLVVDTYLNDMTSQLNMNASTESDGRILVHFKAFNIRAKRNNPDVDGEAEWSPEAVAFYRDGADVYSHNIQGEASYVLPDDGNGVLGRHQWDPQQRTLGLMTAGKVGIFGKEKSPFHRTTRVTNEDKTNVEIEEVPVGWEIGDEVVLSGTSRIRNWDGENHSNAGTEDELFVIGDLQNGDKRILFDQTAAQNVYHRKTMFRHEGIVDRGLFCHLSNLSRNIEFKSIGFNGVITRRGHTMFMRTTNVKIHNARFKDLGRTDKHNIIDDFKFQIRYTGQPDDEYGLKDIKFVRVESTKDEVENVENQRGRYGLHFHRQKDDRTRMSEAHGCVVWGSPGWGMVHHDSHASFKDNVVYYINGGGMISESGSETGIWDHNIVTSVVTNYAAYRFARMPVNTGMNKITGNLLEDDYRFGDAFGNQSRAVRMINNVAASSHEAFAYDAEGSKDPDLLLRDKVSKSEYPHDMFPLQGEFIDRSTVPLLEFRNNEGYGCSSGIRSKNRAPEANHHVLSIIEDCDFWNVFRAMYFTNNFGYLMRNVNFYKGGSAGLLAPNVDNINVVNCSFNDWKVKGFTQGASGNNHPDAILNFVNLDFGSFDEAKRYGDLTYGDKWQVFDESIFNTPEVPVRFTRDEDMDTHINVNSNDYEVVVSGDIVDRLGTYHFGHKYVNPHVTISKRVYDFERRAKLDEYLSRYGVFTDENGTYTILTEYFSDRASGIVTPIEFKIRLVGVDAGDINTPPVVSFEIPESMQVFTEGDNVPTLVNATDDGAIASVTLYVDDNIVRKDDTAPYRWSSSPVLIGLSVGMHTLKAVALDDDGATSEATRMIMIEVGSVEDCAGVTDGTASLDECGICSGGTTGVSPSTPRTWYEDADGDGSGDPLSSVEDCFRPSGYVGNSNDECPLHAEKITPGDCGCNVPEDECFITGGCDAPAYESGKVYSESGTRVIYRGRLYESKWYANGSNVPGNTNGPWKLIDFCGASALVCSSIEPWTASTIYNTSGLLVQYNGKQYESVHWTQNNEPGSHSSWRYTGECEVSLVTSSVANFATGYPNPVTGDEFTVTFAIPATGAVYQLTDPLGNVMSSGTVRNGSSEITISLEDLPSRNYSFNIVGDNINDVILVSVMR